MKRTVLFSLVAAVCALVCGCTPLKQTLEQQLETADTVVIVATQPLPELAGLDLSVLENVESDYRYQTVRTDTAQRQYEALCAAAQDPSTAVLVADLDSRAYSSLIVQLAKQYDLPLLLCGAMPTQQTMDSYEKCWYIGFDPALAAELQAGLLVQAFRDGLIADQNGDYKQSCLCVCSVGGIARQREDYAAHLLQDLELGGIHVTAAAEPLYGVDAEALYQKLDALLLPQAQTVTFEVQEDGETILQNEEAIIPAAAQTELFLCGDVFSTQAVLRAINALHTASADEALAGFATPERRYTAVGFGHSAAIDAALSDGTLLGAVAPDADAAAQAVLALCENLLRCESPTKGTDHHLQDGKYLMLDYLVYYTGEEEGS